MVTPPCGWHTPVAGTRELTNAARGHVGSCQHTCVVLLYELLPRATLAILIAVRLHRLLVEDVVGTQTGPVYRQQGGLVVGPLHTQAPTATVTMGTRARTPL